MHDPANNGCPKNADPKNETCSCDWDRALAAFHQDAEKAAPSLEVDLSAVEARVALGRWPELRERGFRDLYTEEAARLFGVPETEVTAQQRQFAKTSLYHRIYGGEGLPKTKK